jgi:tetratricopeptide (TPR) repeat protein
MDQVRIIIVFAALLVSLNVAAHGSGEAGGGGIASVGGASPKPTDLAKAAYNNGVHTLKKAHDADADALKAGSAEKSAKARDKAQKFYAKAAGEFIDAVGADPTMYQAWNYLGFAKRHLGEYPDALSAYAKALELNPTFPDAIEYRGEAYLGLNQLDSAKQDYLTLFKDSRPLADELMVAMQRWAESHHDNAQGVAVEDIESFTRWVEERVHLADTTASLALGAAAPRWR